MSRLLTGEGAPPERASFSRRSLIFAFAWAGLAGCAGEARPAPKAPSLASDAKPRRTPRASQPPPEPPRAPPLPELEPLPTGPFTLSLPPRHRSAEGGKELLRRVLGLRGTELEAEIYAAIASGNVPAFLRTLAPVEVSARGRRGSAHKATLHVTPDYLAVGSDDDFLRIPMTPQTAQRLADLTGSRLPTPRVVDAIWQDAPGRLEPHAFEGGPNVENKWEYELHQEEIEAQRKARGYPLGMLLAGHKKDIVATRRLRVAPGRVAIYGWHTKNGHPVQPLTTVHARIYADYSHGVRLVHATVLVDGSERPFDAVLADPELSRLVSGEGPLLRKSVRYPLRAS